MGSGHRVHNLFCLVAMEEVLAVLHELQFAKDLGFSRSILESDSKTTVKNIQSPGEDYSEKRVVTWEVN